MPITGPASYVPTAEEFAAHWGNADAVLGAGNELTTPGGVTRTQFVAAKDDLVEKVSELVDKQNDKELARAEVEINKELLLARLVQFNEKVRAFYPGSKWLRMLPDALTQTEGQSRVLAGLEDTNSIWQKMNADASIPSDIVLLNGYTQGMFGDALQALRQNYTALATAETNLKFVREERNDLQDKLYGIMKSYRAVLPTYFAKDHALVESLPRLSPAAGSTPEGVTLTGEWQLIANSVALNWTASTDSNLDHYDVRMCSGPTYDTDIESKIGEVVAGSTNFNTVAGLPVPGDTASYRVYVVLTTGNEAGSNTVTITRPMA